MTVKADALREAAQHFEEDLGPAWGGPARWMTTGTHVAELVAEILRERADEIDEIEGDENEDDEPL